MTTKTVNRDASAADYLPKARSLRGLRSAARDCPLWKDTTQTVLGKGPRSAGLMLVGEQKRSPAR